MDLLGGYGSDAGSSSDDEPTAPAPRILAAPSAAPSAAPAVSEPAPARRTGGLLSGLPAPKAPAAAAQLPAGFFDEPSEAIAAAAPAPARTPAPNGAPSFPARAAARSSYQHIAEEANEEAPAVGPARPPGDAALMGTSVADIPAPSNTKLWSKLPAPQAAKRKVVIRSSLNAAALLAAKGSDSDDDDTPALKRARTGTASKGSGLASFLPPPKHEMQLTAGGTSGRLSLGAGASGAFGSRAAGADTVDEVAGDASGAHGRVGSTAQAASEQYAYTAASDQYAVGGSVQYASAQVPDAGQYSYAQEGQYKQYAAPQQYQQQYQAPCVAGSSQAPAGGAAGRSAAATAAAASGADMSEDMLAAAMAEEAERVARRGGAGSGASIAASIQFKEVKASQLKHVDAARREAQQGMRAALGAEYAQTLRAQATPYVGDKLARRKHQIGTLYHNAKAQELEMLETKAAGMQSKAHTKQKYGW